MKARHALRGFAAIVALSLSTALFAIASSSCGQTYLDGIAGPAEAETDDASGAGGSGGPCLSHQARCRGVCTSTLKDP